MKYNVGVLTKKTVLPEDREEAKRRNDLHDSGMNGDEKKYSEPLDNKT